MKKQLTFLLAITLTACGTTENKKGNDLEKDVKVSEEVQIISDKKSENESPSESTSEISLEEGKVYTVKEFTDIVNKNNLSNLKGKEVEIEGYYLNYNKQKASNDENYEYNVSLYVDEECGFKSDQIFFILKADNADAFKEVKQHSKLKLKGEITGDKFFNSPKLINAELVG